MNRFFLIMLVILVFAVTAVAMPPPATVRVHQNFETPTACTDTATPDETLSYSTHEEFLAEATQSLNAAGTTPTTDGFHGQPAKSATSSVAPPEPEVVRTFRITFYGKENTRPARHRPFYNGGRGSGGPTD